MSEMSCLSEEGGVSGIDVSSIDVGGIGARSSSGEPSPVPSASLENSQGVRLPTEEDYETIKLISNGAFG